MFTEHVKQTLKNMPIGIKKLKQREGEIKAYQKGKITVHKWKDKKDVFPLSTVQTNHTVTVHNRGEQKQKPQVVVDYNDTTGGVDKVDQHLTDYSITRKRGKKYYKNHFSIYFTWHCGTL